jgi:hypothetical protein
MTFDETHSNTASNGDSTHVESSDHKTRMTFTETKLVGSDPSVGAEQTDANLINPWGMSESATSPFWISDNGTGLASIYQVTHSGVTTNPIGPITIAVPADQPPGTTAAPTGVQQLRFRGGLHPEGRISGHLPVRHRGRDDLGLERGSRYAVDHRGG